MDNSVSQPNFVERSANAVGHFALELGETDLHSGIQDPVNALEQLANHAILKPLTGYELPELNFLPAPEVQGTSDKVAKFAGTMVGKIADMVAVGAVLKATGVMGGLGDLADKASDLPVISDLVAPIEASPTLTKLATAFGRGAVMGGITGFALQPAPDGVKNFWHYRGVNALSFSASMAIGSTMGEGITLGLGKFGIDPHSSTEAAIGARTIKTVLRQTSNKVFNVRSAVSLLLHQDQDVLPSVPLAARTSARSF